MTEQIEIVETPESVNSSIDAENNAQKKIYKRKRVLVPAILAIMAIVGGFSCYQHASCYVSTDNAYIEGHNVQISSKVSGKIAKVYIEDNQKVEKGQLIAEVEPMDYQVSYDRALAKLQVAVEKQKSLSENVNLTSITSSSIADQANSGIGAAQAGLKMASKQIAQAKSNLAQVIADNASIKAEADLAQINLERYQKLYKKGVVSKQDYDRAVTNDKSAQAKLQAGMDRASAAESTLQLASANKEVSLKSLDQALGKFKGANTVTQQVSISESQRRMASAEIKQLKAEVEQAKLELSYTKIYAPKSGIITNKSVEEGAYIQVGQPLVAIVPETRWVVANFKETQLTDMKVGQPVDIKVDTYPNKIFKGRIDSIQSSTGSKSSLFPPENAVGSFVKVVQRVPVKITFTEKPDSQFAIVPGMSVIPEVKVK